MKELSLYLVLLGQVSLVLLGLFGLYRIMRDTSRSMDLVWAAVGLTAATQLNLNITRIRYGATVVNYDGAWDWIISNYVGALCLVFLLMVLINTGRALK